MKTFISLLLFFSVNYLSAQATSKDNLVFWSATRKLTVDDFGIKTQNAETNTSYAQFFVDYQVSGMDLIKNNFNKKVRNYLVKSASSIDTTRNVSISLLYQQTLFDMCEIYSRQFRKVLKENRKKIAFEKQFIQEQNQKAMTDFSNRRIEYDRETNFGTIPAAQAEWELQIRKELEELKKFASE